MPSFPASSTYVVATVLPIRMCLPCRGTLLVTEHHCRLSVPFLWAEFTNLLLREFNYTNPRVPKSIANKELGYSLSPVNSDATEMIVD